MGDVAVFEATYDLCDSVYLTDVREEFVAETFALCGTFYKACDIDEAYRCGNGAFRFIHFFEFLKTMVGNVYDADIRFDGAERIVGRFCACFCDSVEECAFSYVGKSYDTDF